jgi:2-phosphosulfolactate phosphatase
VIPAGEHWEDHTLRPCLEDLIGAGAVLAELGGTLSPEAELTASSFERLRRTLRDALARCGSGRELIERGFAEDVALAAEYAVSSAAPVLAGDRFTA